MLSPNGATRLVLPFLVLAMLWGCAAQDEGDSGSRVRPVDGALGGGDDSVVLTGTWESRGVMGATFANASDVAALVEISPGDILDTGFAQWQEFYYVGEPVRLEAPAAGTASAALALICADRSLAHPIDAPGLGYRVRRPEVGDDRAGRVLALRSAWRTMLEQDTGLGLRASQARDTGVLQWAVWAEGGATPFELLETVRHSLWDEDQALAFTVDFAGYVGRLLSTTRSAAADAWALGVRELGEPTVLVQDGAWPVADVHWKAPGPFIMVRNIQFDHKPENGRTDGLNIRWDFGNKQDLDHGKDGEGEWIRAARNEPALYVQRSQATIRVAFKAAAGTQTAQIRATGGAGLPDVAPTAVAFDAQGWSTDGAGSKFIEMALVQPMPARITKLEQSWAWTADSVNGQANGQQFDSTGPHKAYVVLDVPRSPWYDNAQQEPWVNALDFAITTSIRLEGQAQMPAAAGAITDFVFGGYGLEYMKVFGTPTYVDATLTLDLTAFLKRAKGNLVNCHDCATIVHSFANLVGGDSTYTQMRKFGYVKRGGLIGMGIVNNPSPTNLLNPRGTSQDTCTAIPRPPQMAHACDDDIRTDRDPFRRIPFANHGVMRMGGNIYDACAGPFKNSTVDAYLRAAVDVSSARERNDAPGATAADLVDGAVRLK